MDDNPLSSSPSGAPPNPLENGVPFAPPASARSPPSSPSRLQAPASSVSDGSNSIPPPQPSGSSGAFGNAGDAPLRAPSRKHSEAGGPKPAPRKPSASSRRSSVNLIGSRRNSAAGNGAPLAPGAGSPDASALGDPPAAPPVAPPVAPLAPPPPGPTPNSAPAKSASQKLDLLPTPTSVFWKSARTRLSYLLITVLVMGLSTLFSFYSVSAISDLFAQPTIASITYSGLLMLYLFLIGLFLHSALRLVSDVGFPDVKLIEERKGRDKFHLDNPYEKPFLISEPHSMEGEKISAEDVASQIPSPSWSHLIIPDFFGIKKAKKWGKSLRPADWCRNSFKQLLAGLLLLSGLVLCKVVLFAFYPSDIVVHSVMVLCTVLLILPVFSAHPAMFQLTAKHIRHHLFSWVIAVVSLATAAYCILYGVSVFVLKTDVLPTGAFASLSPSALLDTTRGTAPIASLLAPSALNQNITMTLAYLLATLVIIAHAARFLEGFREVFYGQRLAESLQQKRKRLMEGGVERFPADTTHEHALFNTGCDSTIGLFYRFCTSQVFTLTGIAITWTLLDVACRWWASEARLWIQTALFDTKVNSPIVLPLSLSNEVLAWMNKSATASTVTSFSPDFWRASMVLGVVSALALLVTRWIKTSRQLGLVVLLYSGLAIIVNGWSLTQMITDKVLMDERPSYSTLQFLQVVSVGALCLTAFVHILTHDGFAEGILNCFAGCYTCCPTNYDHPEDEECKLHENLKTARLARLLEYMPLRGQLLCQNGSYLCPTELPKDYEDLASVACDKICKIERYSQSYLDRHGDPEWRFYLLENNLSMDGGVVLTFEKKGEEERPPEVVAKEEEDGRWWAEVNHVNVDVTHLVDLKQIMNVRKPLPYAKWEEIEKSTKGPKGDTMVWGKGNQKPAGSGGVSFGNPAPVTASWENLNGDDYQSGDELKNQHESEGAPVRMVSGPGHPKERPDHPKKKRSNVDDDSDDDDDGSSRGSVSVESIDGTNVVGHTVEFRNGGVFYENKDITALYNKYGRGENVIPGAEWNALMQKLS